MLNRRHNNNTTLRCTVPNYTHACSQYGKVRHVLPAAPWVGSQNSLSPRLVFRKARIAASTTFRFPSPRSDTSPGTGTAPVNLGGSLIPLRGGCTCCATTLPTNPASSARFCPCTQILLGAREDAWVQSLPVNLSPQPVEHMALSFEVASGFYAAQVELNISKTVRLM